MTGVSPPPEAATMVAQEIWQTYVVETGQSLPEGLADKLAVAVLQALGLTQETAFKYTHLASGLSTILETTDVPMARKIAGTTHVLSEVERVVSPWVVVEEQPRD